MILKSRSELRFVLNDKKIVLRDIRADQTLLDFLRLEKNLTGTKEGCAEGDCGACTVLVGRLVAGKLKYMAINACIRFLGSLDNCHVVSVEHLAGKDGVLHPIQAAMVKNHGSQCGFCTPGFVMSLYGLFLENPKPDNFEIERALQGNLCRCTGYEPIIKAALEIAGGDSMANDTLPHAGIVKILQGWNDEARVETDTVIIPASLDDFADVLIEKPNATIIAGSTDVGLWVTKHFIDISPAIFIAHLDELAEIAVTPEGIKLGAGVRYTDAFAAMTKAFPSMSDFWNRIGGEQVRNMGTIGGNIANGSPIGDLPPPFIALGASLTLRHGKETRDLLLEDFFVEYGKQDLKPGEFVQSVFVPALQSNENFEIYKISKRRDEDISALCGAFYISLDEVGKVISCRIAFGGMAGTPSRASNVEKTLLGNIWNEATVEKATASFAEDYQPLSDWRASADYRMNVAKNLLRRFYLETRGEAVQLSRSNPDHLEGVA
ncbi:MAG: xanthine dehydrogenase small subunit [Rhizobiaceae bacterium]